MNDTLTNPLGKPLDKIVQEIERQRKARADYVANYQAMKMIANDKDAPPYLKMEGTGWFPLRPLAHDQLGEKLGIPHVYYDKLKGHDSQALAFNVNHWLEADPGKAALVRVLDSQTRAFLSDRYRRRDHWELLETILPLLRERRDLEIASCELTEEKLYLKVRAKELRLPVKVGDIVTGGFVVKNSEVGKAALFACPYITRLVCMNGMQIEQFAQRKRHAGRQIEAGGSDEATELFTDETLEADDRAFFLKVRDLVKACLDETQFEKIVATMRDASENVPVAHPVSAVKRLGEKRLTEPEQADCLTNLLQSVVFARGVSQWDYANAITQLAHTAPTYARADDLERYGGDLLQMARAEFASLVGDK